MAFCWGFTATDNALSEYNGEFCLQQSPSNPCQFIDGCTNHWTLDISGPVTLTADNGTVWTATSTFNCNGSNTFAFTFSPLGSGGWQQQITIGPADCTKYPCSPNCTPASSCCSGESVKTQLIATMYTTVCGYCNGQIGNQSLDVDLVYVPASDSYISNAVAGLCGSLQPFYLKAVCRSGGNGFTLTANAASNDAVLATGFLDCTGCGQVSINIGAIPQPNDTFTQVNVNILVHDPAIRVYPSGFYDSYALIPFAKTAAGQCVPGCNIPYFGPNSCTGVYTGTFGYQQIGPYVSGCASGLAGVGIPFTFVCNLSDAPAGIQFLGTLGGLNAPSGGGGYGWLYFQGTLGGDGVQFLFGVGGGQCAYSNSQHNGAAFVVQIGFLGTWAYGPCPNCIGCLPTPTIYYVIGEPGGAQGFVSNPSEQYFTNVEFPASKADLVFDDGKTPINRMAGCNFQGPPPAPGAVGQKSIGDFVTLMVTPPYA